MDIGKKVEINGEKFIYTVVDTSMGEYAPDRILVSLETGAAYKLPESKGSPMDGDYEEISAVEAIDLCKKDTTNLINITQAWFA